MNFKIFFFDLLSFRTPLAKIFNLSLILLILAILPTEYLIYSPSRCLFHEYILPFIYQGDCPTSGILAGCQCPACGMTRGMSRLLHGDLLGAWNFNRMVFVVLVIMVFMITYNLVKIIRNGVGEDPARSA